jgi:putative glutamine amidotransferase
MADLTQQRPTIGIIGSQFLRPSCSTHAGIGTQYLLAIEAAGGIPLLIHLSRDAAVLEAHYRRCDALLFAGGDDVDPMHYNAAPHPKLGIVEPLRDEVELALARRAAADGKPILGICRGIQLLNVAFGGTLYQDLPAELPGALDHRESARYERTHLAHALTLEAGSWLAARLDTSELRVNTLHHQAVRDLAPGLRAVGRAPDGVIEAVEGTGPSLIVAVQCHPEELWQQADPRWNAVFEGFVAAARRRAG